MLRTARFGGWLKTMIAAAAGVMTAFPVLAAGVVLSPDERARLDAAPITMCVDPDWEPFEKIDADGEHVGIAADLVQSVARRLGARIELVPTKDWDESIAASKDGRCQILSFLNQTPKRDEWLIFTEPLFFDPNVFITREEHPFIADPAALSRATISFPKGTAMEERIRRDYPNLSVIVTDSENEAIALVSEKKADMTMRSLIMAAYTIKKDGWFNLKIAGKLPEYQNRLRIGVRKNETMLRDILNKGVATISDSDRTEIINRHVSIRAETAADWSLIYKIAALAFVTSSGGYYWSWRLRRRGRELERLSQTDALTGLFNRGKIHALYQQEFERCRRYERPLSVLVLDIDHFKQTNDVCGHVVGDKVLVKVAETASDSIRSADFIGRWGGEEFLLLCPETAINDAAVVAERICNAIRCAAYDSGGKHTVSIGVATLLPEDVPESLLKRADAALYQAKRDGRDRVCTG
jgi:diguanylate cyclase (GGDEF)-like protein